MPARRAALLVLLLGCGAPRPVPLPLGTAECSHCHMTLADPRFGAELLTRRHKVFVFDDPGCLAAFVAGGEVAVGEIHSLWVSNYLEPDSLLNVEIAVFIRSGALRTPMDHRVAAVRPGPEADRLAAELNGERLTWADVLAATTLDRRGE